MTFEFSLLYLLSPSHGAKAHLGAEMAFCNRTILQGFDLKKTLSEICLDSLTYGLPFVVDLLEETEACTYSAVGESVSDPSKVFGRNLEASCQAERPAKFEYL